MKTLKDWHILLITILTLNIVNFMAIIDITPIYYLVIGYMPTERCDITHAPFELSMYLTLISAILIYLLRQNKTKKEKLVIILSFLLSISLLYLNFLIAGFCGG